MNDETWDDLLGLIEEGNLLPIVGQGVTTIDANDALLVPWLAGKLAGRLKVPLSDLPPNPNLNDVFSRYLMNGERCDDAYTRLFRILRDEKPEPGPTLCRLASVTGLRLFITTTSDSLLTNALNKVRHGSREATQVYEYSPTSATDIPGRMSDLRGSTVFHILGRASPQVGEFVAWDEDLLEFILGLRSHLVPDVMPHLHRDLADRNVRILALGLNFSDWLLRFFLRVARQSRLTSNEQGWTYLAEGVREILPDSLVMFFGPLAQRMEVINMEPRHFVKELAEHWSEKHPEAASPTQSAKTLSFPDEMPPGAIFVSYVREDEPAVTELVSRLQAQGCNVWLDRERLKSGMNFDHRIEDYVKRGCSLFVSVISHTTESQPEAYFHKERNWAAERAHSFSDLDRDRFYHPLIVDEIDPGAVRREPSAFGGVHRPKIPGGKVTPEFCQRLFDLQKALNEATTR